MSSLERDTVKGKIYLDLNIFMLNALDERVLLGEWMGTFEISCNYLEVIFKKKIKDLISPIAVDFADLYGPEELQQFKQKLQGSFIYCRALLRLFFQQENHLELWNNLLTDPRTGERNYAQPIPTLYRKAKRILFHPFKFPLIYQVQLPLQELMVKHPRASLTATSVLIALEPSLIPMAVGLFTGLTLMFKPSKTHRALGPVLSIGPIFFKTGRYLMLLALMGGIIFPLVTKALINQNIPLPMSALLQLGGFLTFQFLMELRTAWNSHWFEKGNEPRINGSYSVLKRQVIQKTLSPLKLPLLGTLAMSAGLCFPSQKLQYVLNLCTLFSFLSSAHSALRLFKGKGQVEEAVQIVLSIYVNVLSGLPLSRAKCLEIQSEHFFGVHFLTIPFPQSENLVSCHEHSGLVWSAQSKKVPFPRLFTADSLRYGYQIFLSDFGVNDSSQSLIPQRIIRFSPIENFCFHTAPEFCTYPPRVNDLRGIVPDISLTALNGTQVLSKDPFPEVLTSQEQMTNLLRLPLPCFLAYQGIQLFRQRVREEVTPS